MSFASSALLGILSQSVDGAPSVADATAAPSKDTPKSIDLESVPAMYPMYTPLGAAVTSSGGSIQVLRMLFTRVLTLELTPDSLSLSLSRSLSFAFSLARALSLSLSLSLSLYLYLNQAPCTPHPKPRTANPKPK